MQKKLSIRFHFFIITVSERVAHGFFLKTEMPQYPLIPATQM